MKAAHETQSNSVAVNAFYMLVLIYNKRGIKSMIPK